MTDDDDNDAGDLVLDAHLGLNGMDACAATDQEIQELAEYLKTLSTPTARARNNRAQSMKR